MSVDNGKNAAAQVPEDGGVQVVPDAAQWPTTPGLSERPSDDDLWDQTLSDRDGYHESADKLTAAIAAHFGEDFGEHSNLNDPWANALTFMAELEAQQVPEDVRRDAERYRYARAHMSINWDEPDDDGRIVTCTGSHGAADAAIDAALSAQSNEKEGE